MFASPGACLISDGGVISLVHITAKLSRYQDLEGSKEGKREWDMKRAPFCVKHNLLAVLCILSVNRGNSTKRAGTSPRATPSRLLNATSSPREE